MARRSLKSYRPSGKAWIAVSIIGLCVVGIIYAVCAADISLHVQGAYDINLKVGNGATQINVTNIITERTGI